MAESTSTREKTRTGEKPSRASQTLVETIPSNLPRSLTRPIGREHEIQTLRDLLLHADVPLVTLTGLGGAGKTTLALHVAASLLEEFRGGVFFINLSTLIDSKLIIDMVAQTLKVPEEQGRSLLDSLRDFLHGRSILLVLDNLEHLINGAPQVSALLEINPQLKIIVTSREALRVRGEQVVPLESLSDEAASALFIERARAIQPAFHPSDKDIQAILAICRKLDGLPLAIELAAQRTNLFSATSLLQRLQTDLEADSPILSFLTTGARDLPARQRTLRDTIAWSYSLLTETEQRLFRVASLFPAGAGIDSIASVAGIPEAETMESIASLVDKSLLRRSESATPRVVALEALREFAGEQSAQVGESKQNAESFVAYYSAYARKASDGLKGANQSEWFDRISVEHPNLTAAFDMGLRAEAGSPIWFTTFDILFDLHRYWMLRGILHVGEQWSERARLNIEQHEHELARPEDILHLKATIYTVSGGVAWARGHYSKARDWHKASLEYFERLNDEAGIAEALNNLASNQSSLGEMEAALENFKRGILIHRKLGNGWGEMRLLNNLGTCMVNRMGMDDAYHYFEQGLNLARQIGDQYFIALFLHNMANTAVNRGDFNTAEQLLKPSMEIIDSMRLVYLQSWSYMLLAQVELGLGRYNSAAIALQDALRVSEGMAESDLPRVILDVMISFLAQVGNYSAAATMVGAFDAFVKSSRVMPTPYESHQLARNLERIETRLTPDQVRTARERGLRLDRQAAFDFWLEQCQEFMRKDAKVPFESLLTEREMDVLRLLAAGKTNEQISKDLVVVVKTVEKHVANIFIKLGVKNRTEAAAWATSAGYGRQDK